MAGQSPVFNGAVFCRAGSHKSVPIVIGIWGMVWGDVGSVGGRGRGGSPWGSVSGSVAKETLDKTLLRNVSGA